MGLTPNIRASPLKPGFSRSQTYNDAEGDDNSGPA